jgi:hypothetical protein
MTGRNQSNEISTKKARSDPPRGAPLPDIVRFGLIYMERSFEAMSGNGAPEDGVEVHVIFCVQYLQHLRPAFNICVCRRTLQKTCIG